METSNSDSLLTISDGGSLHQLPSSAEGSLLLMTGQSTSLGVAAEYH